MGDQPDRQSFRIGKSPNHWVYTPSRHSSKEKIPEVDLTRRPITDTQPHTWPSPRDAVAIPTNPATQSDASISHSIIHVDPAISALVIIDMQNFFLSPLLGRDTTGPGHQAMRVLEALIPRCRQAGIRVIWCNWGLSEQEVEDIPPAVMRGFGGLNAFKPGSSKLDGQPDMEGEKLVATKPSQIYRGFGTPMGEVTVEGQAVDAGRLLMRDQWNSALPSSLSAAYEEGLTLPEGRRDTWIHKSRMSGMWSPDTLLSRHLKTKHIKTLLFAGVNTDQCVQGTLVDAYNSGWDCVMVRDACGTATPGGREVMEWNVGRSWGFLVDAAGVKRGIEATLEARKDEGEGKNGRGPA